MYLNGFCIKFDASECEDRRIPFVNHLTFNFASYWTLISHDPDDLCRIEALTQRKRQTEAMQSIKFVLMANTLIPKYGSGDRLTLDSHSHTVIDNLVRNHADV